MNGKWKYSGIVLCSVMLFMALHLLIPASLTSETPESSLSELALWLGFPATAVLWGAIAYGCVAFVFWRIEERIPGPARYRGLRYGSAIGVLWLLGYVMCAAKSKDPFIAEFVGGLCDAIPVLVMACLLSRFAAKKEAVNRSSTLTGRAAIGGVVIFTLVFFSARTAAYLLNVVDVGFGENAAYTLGWNVAMGACLGVVYLLLGSAVAATSALQRAVRFGVGLIGLTWGIFILFFPLMLKGQLANTLWMFYCDTLAVSVAYYFAELRSKQLAVPTNARSALR